jgi:twitching motility two-component system response regulator PilG
MTALQMEPAESTASGAFVQGLSIGAFLQYIEADRKSWTLKVGAGGRKGHLHFRDGALVDAETGSIRGEPAALRILSWSDIKIEILGECRDREAVITHSNFHLLMEANRLRDEGLLDEEALDAVERAIPFAEAHRHQEAMAILGQQLKKNARNAPAWLWYSRCLGRMDAIESALKNAYACDRRQPEVLADLQKARSARDGGLTAQVKRCPICWAPLGFQEERCRYCRAHLYVPPGLARETPSEEAKGLFEEAVLRYERVWARERQANARFFLGIARLNLARYEAALDDLLVAAESAPDHVFFQGQLRLLRQHLEAMSASPAASPAPAQNDGHGDPPIPERPERRWHPDPHAPV